jgi:uncharacterized membrane protein YqjE
MTGSSPGPGGWFETLQRVGESLNALVRNRFEIFTVELQEEKLRLLKLLIWLLIAVALGAAGIFVVIAALAVCLWKVAGIAGVVALALLALGTASVIIWRIWKKIQTGPLPFSHTVAEFRKDGECL